MPLNRREDYEIQELQNIQIPEWTTQIRFEAQFTAPPFGDLVFGLAAPDGINGIGACIQCSSGEISTAFGERTMLGERSPLRGETINIAVHSAKYGTTYVNKVTIDGVVYPCPAILMPGRTQFKAFVGAEAYVGELPVSHFSLFKTSMQESAMSL